MLILGGSWVRIPSGAQIYLCVISYFRIKLQIAQRNREGLHSSYSELLSKSWYFVAKQLNLSDVRRHLIGKILQN